MNATSRSGKPVCAPPPSFAFGYGWSPSPCRGGLVAVEAEALHAELAGRQADVAALVGLIAVEAATGAPLAIFVAAFLDAVEPESALSVSRLDGERRALLGEQVVLAAEPDQQRAVARRVLGVARCPGVDRGHGERGVAERRGHRRQVGLILEAHRIAEAGD